MKVGTVIQTESMAMNPMDRLPTNTIIFWNSSSLTDTLIKNYNDDGINIIILDKNNKIIKIANSTTLRD
jgi:hypothetical protein